MHYSADQVEVSICSNIIIWIKTWIWKEMRLYALRIRNQVVHREKRNVAGKLDIKNPERRNRPWHNTQEARPSLSTFWYFRWYRYSFLNIWLNPSMGQINGANAFQCFSKDGKFNSKTQEFRPYMFTVRSHVSKPSTSLPIFSIMSICESTRKCQFDCANAFQFDFSSKF